MDHNPGSCQFSADSDTLGIGKHNRLSAPCNIGPGIVVVGSLLHCGVLGGM